MKQSFPDYEDRPGQRDMAGEILRCLTDKKNLLIEAGTGIGKSFAYLIPAILSQEKTIVSSLPEMDIAHSIEDVKRFFKS